ncbi:WhiB family transcriptional regulator [Streptomyces sp. R11]|uniref:Transcriptional regulator WhiB n=1 Tax=Streptomyces sp. R11 TaxID=3238625 RepID=A0AB39NFT2_9ACTN
MKKGSETPRTVSPVLWRARAACAHTDHNVFFTNSGHRAAARAQQICASCTVTAECLQHAESRPERFGIWGGKTAHDRGWSADGRRLHSRPSPSAKAREEPTH